MKTVNHPIHGTLTISETRTPGKRSYECTMSDGRTVLLSTRRLNQLLGLTKPVDLVSSVRGSLTALGDSPDRVRVARDLWEMVDREFLQ
jgi:hypothetical protein